MTNRANKGTRSSKRLNKTRNKAIQNDKLLKVQHKFFKQVQAVPAAKTDISAKEQLKEKRQLMKSLGIDNMKPGDYIASKADKPQLVTVRMVDVLKDIGGRGLFAQVDIPARTCIGEYTGEVYSEEAFEKYLSTNEEAGNHYALNIDNSIIDGQTKGNFTRYANFSDSQSNASFEEGYFHNKLIIKLITDKPIKAGQQILVDYGAYDQRATKDYYFLNPGDNWMSAREVFDANRSLYIRLKINGEIPELGLERNTELYVPLICNAIIFDKKLAEKEFSGIEAQINLPCLNSLASNEVLDFAQKDTYSALMLACALGQVDNVKWLLAHGANPNQQQNISGLCPLLITLATYATEKKKANRTLYFLIIEELLKYGAEYNVHDRMDRTFIFIAATTLNRAHFAEIINLLKKENPTKFTKIFDYVDENDQDIVNFVIKEKLLYQLGDLLDAHPNYFIENYTVATKVDFEDTFKEAIAKYTNGDCNDLYTFLVDCPCQPGLEPIRLLGDGYIEEYNDTKANRMSNKQAF